MLVTRFGRRGGGGGGEPEPEPEQRFSYTQDELNHMQQQSWMSGFASGKNEALIAMGNIGYQGSILPDPLALRNVPATVAAETMRNVAMRNAGLTDRILATTPEPEPDPPYVQSLKLHAQREREKFMKTNQPTKIPKDIHPFHYFLHAVSATVAFAAAVLVETGVNNWLKANTSHTVVWSKAGQVEHGYKLKVTPEAPVFPMELGALDDGTIVWRSAR